jgi:hypothetical protein
MEIPVTCHVTPVEILAVPVWKGHRPKKDHTRQHRRRKKTSSLLATGCPTQDLGAGANERYRGFFANDHLVWPDDRTDAAKH